MLLVGSETGLPAFKGKLYLADARKYGEYNPDLHKELILEAVRREKPGLDRLPSLLLWLGPGAAYCRGFEGRSGFRNCEPG